MKIEIVRNWNEPTKRYDWWVRLRARNGRIVLVTETYKTRRTARRASGLLKSAGSAPVVYVEAFNPKSRA